MTSVPVEITPTETADTTRLRALLAGARCVRARRAVAVASEDTRVDALYSFSRALAAVGDNSGSAVYLCEALEAASGSSQAKSTALSAHWLRAALAYPLPPELVIRARKALAGVGEPLSAGPPLFYTASLFDGYAGSFDKHLASLSYSTPAAVASLALQAAGRGPSFMWTRCIDLGCGTGLSGAALRRSCVALEGVDVSDGMLAAARARGVYDVLHFADASAWLASNSTRSPPEKEVPGSAAPDLLVAADVLGYIGALGSFFAAAAETISRAPRLPPATSPDTRLLVVSAESLPPGDDGGSAGFRVMSSGRCAHASAYVRRAAADAGLELRTHAHTVLRRSAGTDVDGDIYAFGLRS